jgi:hypothetical protein
MKLIDKDAVLAEIERFACPEHGSLCDRLLDFINSLEVKEVGLPNFEQEVKDFCERFDDRKEKWYNMTPHDQKLMVLPTFANFAMQLAKHFFELGVSCPINNINIEEVKAAAKAWSEDDENTRGCDYIGAVVAEHAFVACAEWLINKAQKGKSYE